MTFTDNWDDDGHRLPEHLIRIGYDADTQRYQYKDEVNGGHWEGPEGEVYGVLRQIDAVSYTKFMRLKVDTDLDSRPPAVTFETILERLERDVAIRTAPNKTSRMQQFRDTTVASFSRIISVWTGRSSKKPREKIELSADSSRVPLMVNDNESFS